MPNHEIPVRFFDEIWNKGREEAVDELTTPDAQWFGFPYPESVLNRQEFKDYVREFRTTFSHIHIHVEETVSEGYRIAVRWRGSMKHTGSGLGFPATGRTVTVLGMTIMHLHDGLVEKIFSSVDLNSAVMHLSALASRSEPPAPRSHS